jgi:IclR family transcriptional regulator, acetate operon repressor
MTVHAAQADGVKSVDRALVLLEAIASSDAQIGVTELARTTDLPTATIHRLLSTLVTRGYVHRDAMSRKYAPGAALLRLDVPVGRFFGPWVNRHLDELVSISGETANLAVLDQPYVVYVAVAPSQQQMRMYTEVGRRAPAHTTAVGKVLLAHRPLADVERMAQRYGLPARTPNSLTDLGALIRALEKVAADGYARDDEEDELGVRCLAVPVFAGGKPLAAMSVCGPTGRLRPAHCERLVPEMHRLSAAIAAELMDGTHPDGGNGNVG